MISFKDKRIKDLVAAYDGIKKFCREYNNVNYFEFDYYTVNNVNLFTIIENFEFDLVDKTIENMLNAIGAIKRIFAKPIIHLKDNDEILPVESVRAVNNETITHATIHSELWETITSDNNIKPRKLLTRNNQDDYQIYENQIFAYTVNIMLAFLKDNIKIYKEFMYNNRNLNFDLLDRLNHINYYLALGKLHTGYIRNLEKYYGIIDRAINRMQYIYNILKSRLNRPVYKINKNVILNKKIVVRKTNILKMHKDYHKVYKLLCYFNDKRISDYYDDKQDEIKEESIKSFFDSYFYFLEVIAIFSIGHFNFKMNQDQKINFENLDINFSFKCWNLTVKSKSINNIRFLELEAWATKHYKTLIFIKPGNNNNMVFEAIKEYYNADEYVLCSPYYIQDAIMISITNIDSFRRLQQLLLKMMIYSDDNHNVCPFCGDELEKENDKFVCNSCKTVIGLDLCQIKNKQYYYSEIKDYKQFVEVKRLINEDFDAQFSSDSESIMHYRNITKLDENMRVICPICHKCHQNK